MHELLNVSLARLSPAYRSQCRLVYVTCEEMETDLQLADGNHLHHRRSGQAFCSAAPVPEATGTDVSGGVKTGPSIKATTATTVGLRRRANGRVTEGGQGKTCIRTSSLMASILTSI